MANQEVIHLIIGSGTHDYVEEFSNKSLLAANVSALKFEYQQLDQLASLLVSLRFEAKEEINGLIVTSPRVVEALVRALELIDAHERHEIVKKFNTEFVFVVGHKTGQECINRLGLDYNKLSADSGNIHALLTFIRKFVNDCDDISTYRLLYPKGSRADSTVEDLLIGSVKIKLQTILVYNTILETNFESAAIRELSQIRIPKPIETLIINLIFFSPSGVEAFLGIDRDSFIEKVRRALSVDCRVEIRFSSIGKTTEAALLRNNCTVHCVSDKPNAISLVSSILKSSF